MEPPDEHYGFYENVTLEPETGMNDHYSKEAAYEQMLAGRKGKQVNCYPSVGLAKRQAIRKSEMCKTRSGYDLMLEHNVRLAETKRQDQFEQMWPLVHAICESLQFESHKWEFTENRLKHKDRNVEFWCHRLDSPVTSTFNMVRGGGSEEIFNVEQGQMILEAIKIARTAVPSAHQQLILEHFGMLESPKIVDERQTIHLPHISFWQRLLFVLTARCKIN